MSQKQVFYEGSEKVYYIGNKDENHQISTLILNFKDDIDGKFDIKNIFTVI